MSEQHPGGVRAAIFTPLRDAGTFATLLLRRAPGERDAGMWELPGGSREQHEGPVHAIRREVREETGLSGLKFIQSGNITVPATWQTPPRYFYTVTSHSEILLSREHSDYRWTTSPLKTAGLNHVSRNFFEQFRFPAAT